MIVRPQRCGYPAPHPQRATTGRRAYPLIVQTVNMFKVRSCLIDGEAVACNKHGLAVFERLRYPARRRQRVLVRLRPAEAWRRRPAREPLETRKATLASLLRGCRPGVRLNEHLDHQYGAIVFHHACMLGCEGIVSKRLGSIYRSGKCKDWPKFKNPAAPAVKREAGEEWGTKWR
jgi:bifunctional non-homologous end joining protein LigD